ncbi:hypothetical protein D3C71_771730 [compost metagenome]
MTASPDGQRAGGVDRTQGQVAQVVHIHAARAACGRQRARVCGQRQGRRADGAVVAGAARGFERDGAGGDAAHAVARLDVTGRGRQRQRARAQRNVADGDRAVAGEREVQAGLVDRVQLVAAVVRQRESQPAGRKLVRIVDARLRVAAGDVQRAQHRAVGHGQVAAGGKRQSRGLGVDGVAGFTDAAAAGVQRDGVARHHLVGATHVADVARAGADQRRAAAGVNDVGQVDVARGVQRDRAAPAGQLADVVQRAAHAQRFQRDGAALGADFRIRILEADAACLRRAQREAVARGGLQIDRGHVRDRDLAGGFQLDVGGAGQAFQQAARHGVVGRVGVAAVDGAVTGAAVQRARSVAGIDDAQIGRVDQQQARLALGRAHVHRTGQADVLLAGDFGKAAVAALCAATRRQAAGKGRGVVGPHRDVAAVALDKRIGLERGARRYLDGGRLAAERSRAIVRGHAQAAQCNLAATGGARDVDGRAAGHVHVFAGDDDLAALLARAHARGVDRAGDLDGAGVAARQHDLAVLHADRLGADDAVGVDHVVDHALDGACGHQDRAAVRADDATVRDQGGYRLAAGVLGQFADRGRGVKAEQPVALEVDRDGLGARQGHAAQLGFDHARVAHRRRHQRGQAAVLDADRAFVDDRGVGLGRGLVELVVAGQEVLVADVRRGGDQTAHVDARTLAEHHAVRVHQHHRAVGVQAAEDRRGVIADHAVQRDALAAGLTEVDRLVGADAEVFPVDDRLAGRLLDVQRAVAAVDDGGRAAHDVAAGGVGVRAARG